MSAWLRTSSHTTRSPCGQYECRGVWGARGYEVRGRHIDNDTLIQVSADRGYVELCCERHAASAIAEAS